jgi:hypothetical protein
MRLYWAVPKHLPKVVGPQSDLVNLAGECPEDTAVDHEDLRRYNVTFQGKSPEKNVRASLLLGYPVYGDVLLAAVGGDWRSHGIVYASDVSLSFYYK